MLESLLNKARSNVFANARQIILPIAFFSLVVFFWQHLVNCWLDAVEHLDYTSVI